jgi:hypothetical protein
MVNVGGDLRWANDNVSNMWWVGYNLVEVSVAVGLMELAVGPVGLAVVG